MRIEIPVIPVVQPIGKFFVGVMQAKDIVVISSADMRRIEEGTDRFVGIQRQLRPDRVAEIGRFVNSEDGTFPTSIVLSLKGDSVEFDEARSVLVLDSTFAGDDDESLQEIGNILDGQHRIEGLKRLGAGVAFEVPVSLFVDPDDEDEAYIFATVNLAQTKVNASLVYDLLDYAKARSPQKSCHQIAVALDSLRDSPFFHNIKRLGTRTSGRYGETLAQATVVTSLLALISEDAEGDRYTLAKGKEPKPATNVQKVPFRPLWLARKDDEIAETLMLYFGAIAKTWPNEWATRERGHILPRTNGFRAFSRFLREVLWKFHRAEGAEIGRLSEAFCVDLMKKIHAGLGGKQFTTDYYPPGTSGETALYKDLRRHSGI